MEEANGRERGGREGYLFGWGMENDITWVPGPTTWVLARVGGVDREFRNSRLTVESALRYFIQYETNKDLDLRRSKPSYG